jgi:hypothetical protein
VEGGLFWILCSGVRGRGLIRGCGGKRSVTNPNRPVAKSSLGGAGIEDELGRGPHSRVSSISPPSVTTSEPHHKRDRHIWKFSLVVRVAAGWLAGGPAKMAATNKCLAHFNKSGMQAKATKKCVADITATDLARPNGPATAQRARGTGGPKHERGKQQRTVLKSKSMAANNKTAASPHLITKSQQELIESCTRV